MLALKQSELDVLLLNNEVWQLYAIHGLTTVFLTLTIVFYMYLIIGFIQKKGV